MKTRYENINGIEEESWFHNTNLDFVFMKIRKDNLPFLFICDYDFGIILLSFNTENIIYII